MAKKKRKAFGGFQIKPDVKLAAIIGKAAVSPAQMTKKIWAYIKKHRLARKS
jgi:chromatin remodeling complex protein RSC6